MNRRKSAIIRIVSWSIVAVILTGILVAGIGGSVWNWNFGGFSFFGINSGNRYADADKYRAGGGHIDGSDVTSLDINWVDARVTIEVYDGDTVRFSEKSKKNLSEKEQLHYYNKNGKLIIQYGKSEKHFLTFGSGMKHKELTIKVPEKTAAALEEIRVDTVTADTTITGMRTHNLRMDSASGDFAVGQCYADKVTGDTVSGNVTLEGSFQDINLDTVSGELRLDSDICPDKVRTDGVSGDVILVIPENDGFVYRKDSVSGSLDCEFQVSREEDRGTYKNGSAYFSFDTVSGDISIEKK